jgi:hypothetical protein
VKEKRKCNSGNPCDQCEKRDRGDQCTYSERKKSGPRAHGGGTLMSNLPARPTSTRLPAAAAAAAKKTEVAAPRPKRPVRPTPAAAAAAASAPQSQQRQLRDKKRPAAAAAAAALAPPQPAERTDTGSSWVSLDEDLSQLSEIDEKGRAKLAWLLDSNHLGDSSSHSSSSRGASRKRSHDAQQHQQQQHHHKRHRIDDDESDDDINMRQQDMAPPFEPPTARRLAARGDITGSGSASGSSAAKPIEKHDSVNVDFGSAAAASDAADEGLNDDVDFGSDFDATELTNTVDNLRDNSRDGDAASASAGASGIAARAGQLRSTVSEDTAGNTSDAAGADDSSTVQCDANGTLERTMSNVARAQGGVLHAFNDDHYDGTGSGSTATVPSDSVCSSGSSGGININISGSAFDRPSKGLLPPASPLTRGFSVSRQRSLDSAIDKLDDNLQLDDDDSVSAFC